MLNLKSTLGFVTDYHDWNVSLARWVLLYSYLIWNLGTLVKQKGKEKYTWYYFNILFVLEHSSLSLFNCLLICLSIYICPSTSWKVCPIMKKLYSLKYHCCTVNKALSLRRFAWMLSIRLHKFKRHFCYMTFVCVCCSLWLYTISMIFKRIIAVTVPADRGNFAFSPSRKW